MSLAVFVDAGLLLSSEDGADRVRQQVAIAWLSVLWQRRAGRLSTQVLDSFYLMATRRAKPPMPAGDARAEVRRYALWQPWQTDQATVESAWAIESRYGLDYSDSLLVAAAQHLGCRYLLSESLAQHQHQPQPQPQPQKQLAQPGLSGQPDQLGPHYGGVQVINPFHTSMTLLDASF